jgi:hypothetical protein
VSWDAKDDHIVELQEVNAGLVERLQAVRRILALNEQPGGPWGNPEFALQSIRDVLAVVR